MKFTTAFSSPTWHRALLIALSLAPLPLLVAGCADDSPPVVHHYAAPNYEYLTKLRLNVSNISIEDRIAPPAPQDEAAQAPTPPDQALEQMAHDRLVAAGSGGTAIFSIDRATLMRNDDGSLNGEMAVHMDLLRPDGSPGGYVAARVARSHTPGSDPEDAQEVRHDLVTGLMADMNVEFEFQLRRNLRAWLMRESSPSQAVKIETLAPPPSATDPMARPPATDVPEMSPPPGVLHLPGQ